MSQSTFTPSTAVRGPRNSTGFYRTRLDRLQEIRTQESTGLPADARSTAQRREILVCGVERPFTAESFTEPRPTPNVLAASLAAHTAAQPRQQLARRSSGCGAQVHGAAYLESRVWCGGVRDVTDTVIAIEDQYVPSEAFGPFAGSGREVCGCLSGFVGCAVCGNHLGTLLTPCNAHMSLVPSGSSAVYTFLPTSVSAQTPPNQIPRIIAPRQSQQSQSQPQSPLPPPSVLADIRRRVRAASISGLLDSDSDDDSYDREIREYLGFVRRVRPSVNASASTSGNNDALPRISDLLRNIGSQAPAQAQVPAQAAPPPPQGPGIPSIFPDRDWDVESWAPRSPPQPPNARMLEQQQRAAFLFRQLGGDATGAARANPPTALAWDDDDSEAPPWARVGRARASRGAVPDEGATTRVWRVGRTRHPTRSGPRDGSNVE